jgi:hypothetical protein
MQFQKAQRRQARLRLALTSPSGGGKTYSALRVATGLARPRKDSVGGIAFIDTERRSASLYADVFEFDALELEPPFAPERYVEALKVAQAMKYDVVIVDSLSHAWAGEGGILDIQDRKVRANPKGNSFTAWKDVTPQHNQLVDAILGAECHVIATMRTKTAYEVVDDGGKKIPKKVGMAPIQRDGMEYEFTTVLDLAVDSHLFTATKDRTGLFIDQHDLLTEETGVRLRAWLERGTDEWEGLNDDLTVAARERGLDGLKDVFKRQWNAYRESPMQARIKARYEELKTDLGAPKTDPEDESQDRAPVTAAEAAERLRARGGSTTGGAPL